MVKKINNLMSNGFLLGHIQRIVALEYDMANCPEIARIPIEAEFEIIVEPTKMEDLEALTRNKVNRGEVEGMIQLTRMTAPQAGGQKVPLDPAAQVSWNCLRDEMDKEGHYNCPVVIIAFFCNGSRQNISYPTAINSDNFKLIRNTMPVMVPALGRIILGNPTTPIKGME